ncbi:hypothetical protein QJS66_05395 [Kocuria rhizophila]|nr:hypothetical protein QJS66_05395 [Kocuria rhizophila]
MIKGRMQRRDDGSITISAQELTVPEPAWTASGRRAWPCPSTAPRRPRSARSGSAAQPQGDSEVASTWTPAGSTEIMRLGPQYRVNLSPRCSAT